MTCGVSDEKVKSTIPVDEEEEKTPPENGPGRPSNNYELPQEVVTLLVKDHILKGAGEITETLDNMAGNRGRMDCIITKLVRALRRIPNVVLFKCNAKRLYKSSELADYSKAYANTETLVIRVLEDYGIPAAGLERGFITSTCGPKAKVMNFSNNNPSVSRALELRNALTISSCRDLARSNPVFTMFVKLAIRVLDEDGSLVDCLSTMRHLLS